MCVRLIDIYHVLCSQLNLYVCLNNVRILKHTLRHLPLAGVHSCSTNIISGAPPNPTPHLDIIIWMFWPNNTVHTWNIFDDFRSVAYTHYFRLRWLCYCFKMSREVRIRNQICSRRCSSWHRTRAKYAVASTHSHAFTFNLIPSLSCGCIFHYYHNM